MITVNGKKLDIENMQLHDLLVRMELANQLCAVEVNKTLVPHKEREACELQDGDIVEIVTLVGGG